MTAPRPLAVQLDAFRAGPRKPRTPQAPYQLGSETSRAAAKRSSATLQRNERIVLDYIRYCGAQGATRKEIAIACFQREQNRVTGRVDTLLRKRLIERTGMTRDGGEVLRATDARNAQPLDLPDMADPYVRAAWGDLVT